MLICKVDVLKINTEGHRPWGEEKYRRKCPPKYSLCRSRLTSLLVTLESVMYPGVPHDVKPRRWGTWSWMRGCQGRGASVSSPNECAWPGAPRPSSAFLSFLPNLPILPPPTSPPPVSHPSISPVSLISPGRLLAHPFLSYSVSALHTWPLQWIRLLFFLLLFLISFSPSVFLFFHPCNIMMCVLLTLLL